MRKMLWIAGLVLAVAPAAVAQEAGVAGWAPKWKVGDWWEIKTYQKDTARERTSPEPAEGAMPRLKEQEDYLPDFPPLRDGIPLGYKPGNRFRFEVVRLERFRHDDDPPDATPEHFWVVSVKTLEGNEPRTAELWYTATDLTLARVILDPKGKRREDLWTQGTAQVAIPASAVLGFPLDWPNLQLARKGRDEVRCGKQRYEQRVRSNKKEMPDTELQLKLTPISSKRKDDDDREPAALFVWKPGYPYWLRLMARDYLAMLDKRSK